MVEREYSERSISVNVRIPQNQELRASSLLEANYANKEEPVSRYPPGEVGLRTFKPSRTTNLAMT